MAVRYIALPLLGVVVVKAAHHFGLVGSNSLFQFVLMLQYALPPAMSNGTTSSYLSYGCCNFHAQENHVSSHLFGNKSKKCMNNRKHIV